MADVRLTALEAELLYQFRLAECSSPSWARPYPPPIPLVGVAYAPGQGLMVYASAENLTWMDRDKKRTSPRWESFCEDTAAVRYWHQYQNQDLQEGKFFPDVGMAPVNNGGLLCAAWLASYHCDGAAPSSPAELLRGIALANWCKLVVDEDRNVDYARDIAKLRFSLRFVEIELTALRPKIVIMPKTILRHGEIRETMQRASPRTRFVGLMQCNARAVNIHLNDLDEDGQRLRRRYAETPLACWMTHVRRMKLNNAWRFLAHAERELVPSCISQRNIV